MSRRQETTSSALIVTTGARQLCRAAGTTAWAVLQDVALDADLDPHGAAVVASTNVRRIAGHLGISKDTAARALARLADAGLLVRRGGQRGANGEFGSSAYELRLDPGAGLNLDPALSRVSRCPVGRAAEAESVPVVASGLAEDVRSDAAEFRARRSRGRVFALEPAQPVRPAGQQPGAPVNLGPHLAAIVKTASLPERGTHPVATADEPLGQDDQCGIPELALESPSPAATGSLSTSSAPERHHPGAVPLTVGRNADDHPEKRFIHWHPAVPSTSAAVPAARAGASPC